MKKNSDISKGGKMDMSHVSDNLEKSKEILISSYIIGNCMDRNIPLKKFINKLESELIKKTLLVADGNQRTAASILGIKPTTLNEKMKKFGIKKIDRSHKISILKNFIFEE